MGIIHHFFSLALLLFSLKETPDRSWAWSCLGGGTRWNQWTPLLQKQASLFLFSGYCDFGSFYGRGAALLLQLVSSGLGRKKKIAAPNLLQRIEDNKKKKEKNKQKRGKVLRRILGTLFRMETVSRGSLLFSRPQNYSPVSISPMLSLSDAALTEKPAETFGI